MTAGRAVLVRVLVVGLCSVLWSPLAAAAPRPVPAVSIGSITDAKIQVRGEPDWMVSDGSGVWVQRPLELFRIDPSTNTVTATVTVDDEVCQGVGFGDGALWRCARGGMVRIDPATATVSTTIPLEKSAEQGHLPVVAGRVWVITGADAATLVGVNTATNTIDTVVPLDARCSQTAAGFEAIWIACRSGVLLRVDPIAGAVIARVEALPLAVSVITNAQSVFVGYEKGVARIDPLDNTIVGRAKAPSGLAVGIAADDDHVWVRAPKPYPFLRVIDADSMKIVARVTSKLDSGGDILAAFGSIWTSTYDDAFVFRLDPAQLP